MLKELQEVVGHLNFVCKVIAPGRAFLRRLCEAMSGLNKTHHRHRLSSRMKDDQCTWLHLLDGFSSISFWMDEVHLGAEFQVQSDAATQGDTAFTLGANGVPAFGR